jgi:hypothetical protein
VLPVCSPWIRLRWPPLNAFGLKESSSERSGEEAGQRSGPVLASDRLAWILIITALRRSTAPRGTPAWSAYRSSGALELGRHSPERVQGNQAGWSRWEMKCEVTGLTE